MTIKGKTFKDTKEEKELNKFYKERKEGHREERGGHRNLLREVEEENMLELAESMDLLRELDEELL
jgi:hypothetical protein